MSWFYTVFRPVSAIASERRCKPSWCASWASAACPAPGRESASRLDGGTFNLVSGMPATAISTGVAEAVYRTVSGIPGKPGKQMSSRQLTHQAVTAAATDTHGLIQRRPLAVNSPAIAASRRPTTWPMPW